MQPTMDQTDQLIVQRPIEEFEAYVKKCVQIQSKFEDQELDLYFEALDLGKELLKED